MSLHQRTKDVQLSSYVVHVVVMSPQFRVLIVQTLERVSRLGVTLRQLEILQVDRAVLGVGAIASMALSPRIVTVVPDPVHIEFVVSAGVLLPSYSNIPFAVDCWRL